MIPPNWADGKRLEVRGGGIDTLRRLRSGASISLPDTLFHNLHCSVVER
jgi:hypothetical protein